MTAERRTDRPMAVVGTPSLLVVVKMRGASPREARECIMREEA